MARSTPKGACARDVTQVARFALPEYDDDGRPFVLIPAIPVVFPGNGGILGSLQTAGYSAVAGHEVEDEQFGTFKIGARGLGFGAVGRLSVGHGKARHLGEMEAAV